MSYEFLRPRENRCKWFNEFGVMRRRIFIERGDKTKFSHKHNRLNRFTKWMNRFRQQKDRQKKYEGWYDSRRIWVDSSVPRWRLNRFNLRMNRFNESQRVMWDDSSIKDTMYAWIDSDRSWIDSHEVRNFSESIQIVMRRFKLIQNEFWHFFDPKWILTLFQTTQNIKNKLYRL